MDEDLITFENDDQNKGVSKSSSNSSLAVGSDQDLQDGSLKGFMKMMLEEQRKREDALHELIRQMNIERQGSNCGSGCSSAVTNSQEFMRRTKRSFESIRLAIEDLQAISNGRQDVMQLSSAVTRLQSKLNSYENFFENKVDLLDGDAGKDEAIKDWEYLQCRAEKEIVTAKCIIEKQKKLNSAGPLPEGVRVPSFSGDMMAYPQWWEEFEMIVHNNESVSTYYKMLYLKGAMKGDASHVLDGLGVASENYVSALEIVKQRFGSKRVITRHLVRSLTQMEPVESMDPKPFLALTDMMISRHATLKTQVKEVDDLLIPLLEDKLPSDVRQMWERHLGTMVKDASYANAKMFFDFIRKEAAARIASVDQLSTKEQKGSERKSHKPNGKDSGVDDGQFSAAALTASTQFIKQKSTKKEVEEECENCGAGNHTLADCPDFLALSPNARREIIESQQRCRVCFKKAISHKDRIFCKNECKNEGCGWIHHPLLCNVGATLEFISNSCMTDKIVGNCLSTQDVLLPTAIAKLRNGKCTQLGRVGFDSFSQSSFVTTSMAKKLKLKLSKPETMTIRGFGGKPLTRAFKRADLEVVPKNGMTSHRIRVIVCNGPICDRLSAVSLDPNDYQYLADIQLSDELPRGPVELDVLIGADFFGLMVNAMVPAPRVGLPFVMETTIGTVLAGPYPTTSPNRDQSCLLITKHDQRSVHDGCDKCEVFDELEKSIERCWDIEAFGITENKRTLTKDGCYHVKLPFRDKAMRVVNNYKSARKQLESMEQKLVKNPERLKRYDKAILEYEKLGFATELTAEEAEGKKWKVETEVPKVGDVCLITEENSTRPHWQIARVNETIRGKDGLVQMFDCKLQKES